MVLRKPYAFLIKNFRIIHIIFALILLFVRRNFGKVVTFFSKYEGQTFSSYSSIVLIRIDLILYLAVIVVISFAIMMLVLMKRKEKPIVLYISVLVYYIIILILMFVASNIMMCYIYIFLLVEKLELFTIGEPPHQYIFLYREFCTL